MSDHEKERQRTLRHIRQVMGTYAGRAFVWRILERARIYQSSYTPNPHDTAFNEGRRSAGLALMDDLDVACPGQIEVMRREALAAEKPEEDAEQVGSVDVTSTNPEE